MLLFCLLPQILMRLQSIRLHFRPRDCVEKRRGAGRLGLATAEQQIIKKLERSFRAKPPTQPTRTPDPPVIYGPEWWVFRVCSRVDSEPYL